MDLERRERELREREEAVRGREAAVGAKENNWPPCESCSIGDQGLQDER